jgi:hypothetical protein
VGGPAWRILQNGVIVTMAPAVVRNRNFLRFTGLR